MRLKISDRIDLVLNRYLNESLKSDTRIIRGSGTRVHVKCNVVIHKSFSKFLARSKSKEDLFGFLAGNFFNMNLYKYLKKIIYDYRDYNWYTEGHFYNLFSRLL